MFAVIKTGGKQYKVATDQKLTVERLPGEAGDLVAFESVLMVGDEKASQVGSPFVAGATVAAEILEQTRGPKIIVFKKRRRKNSQRKNGHRQDLTTLRITEILTDGKKPSAKKAAKPAKKAPEPEAKPEEPEAPAEAEAAEAKPKAATKKTAAKKDTAKKSAAKKPAAKKTAAKKASAKKDTAKKPAAKKTAAKKSAKKSEE